MKNVQQELLKLRNLPSLDEVLEQTGEAGSIKADFNEILKLNN